MKSVSRNIKTLSNWLQRLLTLGLPNSVRLYRNLKRERLFSLKVYGNDFFLRGNTVDFAVFNGIFLNREYDFDIGFSPQYIIDAGAFIGASAVWFSHRYPGAEIIAIEPETSNFDLLKKNTLPYTNISPLQAALFSEEAALKIIDDKAEKYAFRVERDTGVESLLRGYTIEAVMRRFGLPRIDLLKIDIEGAEYELFSMPDISWLNKVKVLVIELHEYFRPGVTDLFYSRLDILNYEMRRKGENIIIINREAAR